MPRLTGFGEMKRDSAWLRTGKREVSIFPASADEKMGTLALLTLLELYYRIGQNYA